MIAAIILLVSILTLGQFFVSYCRSLVAVYSEVELSPQAREMAGLDDRALNGDAFHRLVQLIELCPAPADDRWELRAIRSYFGMMSLLRALRPLAPAGASWAERERAACAYFAAVALDRRMVPNGDAIT